MNPFYEDYLRERKEERSDESKPRVTGAVSTISNISNIVKPKFISNGVVITEFDGHEIKPFRRLTKKERRAAQKLRSNKNTVKYRRRKKRNNLR